MSEKIINTSIRTLHFPIFLVLYEIAAYLSNDIYLPALLPLAQSLQISSHLVQWTLTIWFLGCSSMHLLVGPLADRYGRRVVLFTGAFLFVCSSLICAIAPNITILLIARFIQGCTISSVIVAGYATIHESYESKKAIEILAFMSSITILAPAFGPLLGGVILQFASWRVLFGLLTIMAMIVLPFLWRYMPNTYPPEKYVPLNIGKIIKSYQRICCSQRFLGNIVPFCFLFSGMMAWMTAGPILIVKTLHHPPVVFGIYQTIIFGGFILGTRMLSYAIKRFAIRRIISTGLAIAGIGATFGLIAAVYWPDAFSVLIAFWTLYALGVALTFGPLSRLSIEATEEPMGARMAIFSTFMTGAATLSSGIISMFSQSSALLLALFIFIMAAGACFFNFYLKKEQVAEVH